MGFSLIANGSKAGAANGVTSDALDTTGASLIVVALSYVSATSIPTLFDSRNNTWVGLTPRDDGVVGLRLFYCFNPSVGVAHTFSAAGTQIYPCVFVQAWTGEGTTAAPLDQQNGAGGNASVLAAGSVTPSESGELLITAVQFDNNSGGSVSVNGGFTLADAQPYASGVHEGGAMAYKVSSAAVNPQWNIGNGALIHAAVATFREVPPATANIPAESQQGTWNLVEDFAADPTGGSDCSGILESALQAIADAGGGTLFCPPGIYLLSRALQDTNITNAQVRLPKIGTGAIYETSPQVGIVVEGALPAPTSGASTALPASGYTVFKSTLTSAGGLQPSVIAHPFIGADEANNLQVNWKNLIFQLPPNPVLSALNLGHGRDAHLDGIMVHAGSITPASVTEPTHVPSTGIIMNRNNMGNMNSIRNSIVWGMYVGFDIGELLVVGHMVAWSCKIGLKVSGAFHANTIQYLGTYECPVGISTVSAIMPGYLNIDLWDFENSNQAYYQPWQDLIYNVDDAANLLHGKAAWHGVRAGVGVIHSVTKNGGTSFGLTEL